MTEPTLKKKDFPHVFTTEERRKGQRKATETRRERAKSHAERLREKLEAIEDELVGTALEQARSDWRALMALYDRAYGTPAKAEPERIELDVGSSEARGVSLSEIIGTGVFPDVTTDDLPKNGESAAAVHGGESAEPHDESAS